MSTGEVVLCAARAALPASWLPERGAVALDEPTLCGALGGIEPLWIPRLRAEGDPAFKQWIPYLLLENDSKELAAYPRRGTEARLHGRHSLGLGGHVNPCDARAEPGRPDPARWWLETLGNGLHRELAEEFPAASAGATRLLGIVNEETGPVGRVHLGIVFHHRLDFTPRPPDGELEGLVWLPRASIGKPPWTLERFETWSALSLGLLRPRHALRDDPLPS